MKNKKRKLKQDIQNLIRYIIHILMYGREKIIAEVYNCKDLLSITMYLFIISCSFEMYMHIKSYTFKLELYSCKHP